MAAWYFRRPGPGKPYVVSRKDNGLEVLLASSVEGLHQALVDVAHKLQVADLVYTPEGLSVVLSPFPVKAKN